MILSRHRLPCPHYGPFPGLTQNRYRLTQNAVTTDHLAKYPYVASTAAHGHLASSSPAISLFNHSSFPAALGVPYYRVEPPSSNKVMECFQPLRTIKQDRRPEGLSLIAPLTFIHWTQRHHIQYLSSSAQETAYKPVIWGITRLPPSQISSGRLHKHKNLMLSIFNLDKALSPHL